QPRALRARDRPPDRGGPQLRRVRRRLPHERERRHAPPRAHLGAPHRRRRRSGRRFRHRVPRARARRDAVHPAQAGPPHERGDSHDSAAGSLSADVLPRQLRRPRAPVGDCRVVFVTGTGLSHEPGRGATLAAAATARAAGVPVVVDVDYRPDQWDSAADFAAEVRTLLRSATLAIGTEEEIDAAATGAGAADPAAALLAAGIEALVVKRGARGATIVGAHGPRVDVAPFPVDVLNVLGAGDAFASGLLYGYLQGWPLERAARMGNACGAIIVTRHGCANFMPTLDEVAAFVAARGEAAI